MRKAEVTPIQVEELGIETTSHGVDMLVDVQHVAEIESTESNPVSNLADSIATLPPLENIFPE